MRWCNKGVSTAMLFALACGDGSDTGRRADSGGADDLPARAVLSALRARDGVRLAALVHPQKGVRFTPYGFVRRDRDVVIPRDDVARLFTDTTSRTWGEADGTGDPLHWPFERYYRRYVYDLDFAAAPVVRYGQPPARSGNTPNTIATTYPAARWVELHFPMVDARYQGMDWRSLWLVFELHRGEWLLTGIVHESWTI